MKSVHSSILIIVLFLSSCTFMQEIYEPRDLLIIVRSVKDYQAPNVAILSPTNGQEVATTFQITGTAVDIGVKTETAGIDLVCISLDANDYTECKVENGSWQTVFSNLSIGWHTNFYFARDKRGNTSATNRLVFLVQNTIPSLLVTIPANGILTNEPSIYMEGIAEIGNPYMIRNVLADKSNSSITYRTSYSYDKKIWSSFITLSEGTNRVIIKAIASSGKTNTVVWKLILDKRAPDVIFNSPSQNEEVGGLYTLSGTIFDNLSGIESVFIRIDSGTMKPLNLSNGAFSTNIALPPAWGYHSNIIIVRDFAHNCETNVHLVQRKAIPSLTLNFPSGYSTNVSIITLGGMAFIDQPYSIDFVKVSISNKTLLMLDEVADSNWSYIYTMNRFSNNLTIRAFGNNGKTTILFNRIVYFDTNKPSCISGSIPSYTNVSTIVFRGTASDNLRIGKVLTKRSLDGWMTANGTTNWSQTVNLSTGANVLQVYALDTAGNISTTYSHSITLDQIAPNLTIQSLPGFTNKTTIWVKGTANDASSIHSVRIRVGNGSWNNAAGTASWSNQSMLTEGSNVITAICRDTAGNTTTNSCIVNLDTVKPTLTFTAPTGDITINSNTFRVAGTTSDIGSGVAEVWVSTNGGISVKQSGTTTWSTNLTLYSGSHSITAYAKDFAGNTSLSHTVQITDSLSGNKALTVFRMDAGVVWTARMTDVNRNWFSVASSADGTKLVAGVNDGYIYTSTDSGVNWTARMTDQNRPWYGIASSANGTKLVAVAVSGYIYTSTDSGVNWTQRDSSRQWYGVASSTNGVKLVATVNNGQIYTSADSGVNWTARESSRQWFPVASSADGTKLVAGVDNENFLYYSTNSGATWTKGNISISHWRSVASSADGTKLAAVAIPGCIYTSTDSGANWTYYESTKYWTCIASSADGTRLAAVANNQNIYISTNSGASWTARASIKQWYGIAFSADGSKLVACASSGYIYTSSAASGAINEGAHTISVSVPSGTSRTALVFDFRTTGATVKVGSTVQTSGVTPNDFTNSVTYTVTAADGSVQNYTVTVSAP